MKKSFAGIVAILCALIMLNSCASSQEMQYKGFQNFKVSNITQEPKVNVDVKLYNPNFFGATIKSMEFSVMVDNKPIGSAGIVEPIKVKRKSEFVLPVECGTSLDKMGGLLAAGLQSYFSEKEVPVGIEGNITLQKFIFFKRTYAFKYTDELDVKKIIGN